MNIIARPMLLLLLFVLCSHAVILLNQGHYWDGWIPYILMQKDDWETLREFWMQTGQPQVYYLFYGLNALSHDSVTGYRIVTIICMLCITLSIHALCRRVIKLPTIESAFVAAFAATWPFYNVFISEGFLHYITCIALFYSGWALYFMAPDPRKPLYHTLAFLMIGISSLTLNSLIIFYYAFVMICFVYTGPPECNLKKCILFCKKRWALILFPIAIFTIKTLFFRPYGMYAGYNGLIFNDHGIAESLSIMVRDGAITLSSYQKIFKILKLFYRTAWPILLLLWPLCYLVLRCWKRAAPTIENNRSIATLSALAVVFLLLAVAPYAAAGKFLYAGWGERHGMLMAPGFALLLASLGLLITHTGQPKLAALLYSAILMINVSTLNYRYFMWQARSLMDQSVIHGLVSQPPPPAGTLITYKAAEDFVIYPYESYELSGLFFSAWNQEKWYGVPQTNDTATKASYLQTYLENTSDPFRKKAELISDFQPIDCVALLKVEPNDPNLSRTEALKGYYFRRLLLPDETAGYVQGLFNVQLLYPNGHCG